MLKKCLYSLFPPILPAQNLYCWLMAFNLFSEHVSGNPQHFQGRESDTSDQLFLLFIEEHKVHRTNLIQSSFQCPGLHLILSLKVYNPKIKLKRWKTRGIGTLKLAQSQWHCILVGAKLSSTYILIIIYFLWVTFYFSGLCKVTT